VNGARVVFATSLLAFVALIAGVAYFVGDTTALGSTAIRQASPDQLANAMRNDQFYSDYRKSSLVVRGVVASVGKTGPHTIINFKTASRFGASCSASAPAATVRRGSTITVLAEGEEAERLTSAVRLIHCVIVSSHAP